MAKLWDDTPSYNSVGRSVGNTPSGNSNFFTKKIKSAENAIGTTAASIVSPINNEIHNAEMGNMLQEMRDRRQSVANKYGYADIDALYTALDEAEANGDTVTANRLLQAEQEDRALTRDSSNKIKKSAADYNDYLQNSWVSKKIDQDRGKFAGSAINTLSTGFDIASMAAGIPNGPGVNALQGAVEGVADELEQNGFENFDWGRAGQNIATGAAAGAATGALNNAVNARLASNGGNIINGRNFVTKGVNSALKSGVGRGALSGAVGGGVGAATGSALSGQDIGTGIANTLQGAGQGAIQGGIAGGTMSLANRAGTAALNRYSPETLARIQNNAQAWDNWKNSGNNFDERLTNTLTSGDSAVGEWLQGNRQSGLLNKLGSVGNTVEDYSDYTHADLPPDIQTRMKIALANGASPDEIDIAATAYSSARADANRGAYANYNSTLKDYNRIMKKYGADADFVDEGSWTPTQRKAMRAYDTLGEASDAPTTLGGWLKKAGTRVVDDINNRGVGLSVKDVDNAQEAEILPRDIRNMQVNNNTAENPATELYRTVTGGTEAPRTTDTDLMYGESELGNRTRRGMLADSLERFGNTLEGAQTNVTRAAAKDLGIESTGKVVENVRKKTGLTNLETQAAFAKELTGDVDSLMDRIQKNALTASEDGKGYKVNTDSVSNNVETIVDEEIPLSLFGSQNARNKFIGNLRRDITSYDSDILTKANKFKAVAADLRGKGVVEPAALDKAKSKVYTKIANELDDLSYKAIPQDNVDAMFDATINEMRGRANQAEANGNKDIAKAYNQAANKLDAEPRTIKSFRSFKKDFVDVSKINELTQRAENGAAVQMGRSFGGSLKRFGNSLLQRPVNATLAKAGGMVNDVADNIANRASATAGTETPAPTPVTTVSEGETATVTSSPSTQLYNIIGRNVGRDEGEQAAAEYIQKAARETGPVTLSNNANASSTALYNSVYGTPSTNSGSATTAMTTGDYYTDLVGRAMMAAAANNDVEAFGPLYEMYQSALANQQQNSTSEVKLTDKQRQANAAERALNDFETAEHNFAYDVSDIPVIGNIANLGGNEYASKAEALALQIGYMLSGATVNAQEAKNIGMAYVPQPRDNEAVRRSKLAQIRGIISDYQKTYAD